MTDLMTRERLEELARRIPYRAGVSDVDALGIPPSDDAVWRVINIDTGALIGVVAKPGACRDIEAAAQRAMDLYGLPVGSFRVERIR